MAIPLGPIVRTVITVVGGALVNQAIDAAGNKAGNAIQKKQETKLAQKSNKKK